MKTGAEMHRTGLPSAFAQRERRFVVGPVFVWKQTVATAVLYSLRLRVPGATVQDLLGHAGVETTRIYTHVMQKLGLGVRSPLDALATSVAGEVRADS